MAYPNGVPKVFTYGPSYVDEVLATTTANYKKTLADNIYVAIPTLDFLVKKGKKTSQVVEGESLVVPIVYKFNSTAMMYSADDILNINGQNNYTAAQYLWKQAAVTVRVNGLEATMNKGKQALINLVSARLKDAEKSGMNLLSQELFIASPTSLDLIGLPTLVDATSSIGDINSSSYSWWQANVITSGSFSAQGVSDWRNLHNTLSQYGNNEVPTVYVMPQAIHQYYEGTLVPQERFVSTKEGDAGFGKLAFKMTPTIWDPYATSGTLYGLNTNHIELAVGVGKDFEPGNWIEADNQDTKICKLLWTGVLYSDARRYNGKLTSITA